MEQAWRLRWGSLLSCIAARAVATIPLELLGVLGADGDTPASHEVERDFGHAGLARGAFVVRCDGFVTVTDFFH